MHLSEAGLFGMLQGALLAVCAFILFLLIVTAILMWLWNWTMPEVFKLPSLTFWQTLRLSLISSLLFGAAWPQHFFPQANSTPAASVQTTQMDDLLYKMEQEHQSTRDDFRKIDLVLKTLQAQTGATVPPPTATPAP